MIPYMAGKLAPYSSNLTRGLVKSVPGRGYFRALPSQNGDKYVTSPSPPIVELVSTICGVFLLGNKSELSHNNDGTATVGVLHYTQCIAA